MSKIHVGVVGLRGFQIRVTTVDGFDHHRHKSRE